MILRNVSAVGDGPPLEHSIRVEPWGSEGDEYFFTPHAVPPGNYEVFPDSGWLRGDVAKSQVHVVSPRFEVDVATAHRMTKNVITSTSANAFPLTQYTETVTLRRRPLTTDTLDVTENPSPIDTTSGESVHEATHANADDPDGSLPVADKQSHPSPTPITEPEEEEEARLFEFRLRTDGSIEIPRDTFDVVTRASTTSTSTESWPKACSARR